jgi:hypothetical protein
METKFWRLLSAFENLTNEETAALRERNFRYFTSLHETKTEILPELLRLAEGAGICTNDPYLKSRMVKLMEAVQTNAVLVEGHLAENTAAQQKARAAVRRLRSFSRTYSTKTHCEGEAARAA